MSLTVNYGDWLLAAGSFLDYVVEDVRSTYYVGKLVAFDHLSTGYAFVYTFVSVSTWLLVLIALGIFSWFLVKFAMGKLSLFFLSIWARRHVKPLEDVEPLSFVGKEKGGSGASQIYTNLNGVSICVKDNGEVVPLWTSRKGGDKPNIPEMAMPTSSFVPTGEKHVTTEGVMSIRSGGVVIGMASCIGYKTFGPCLVTASHVLTEVWKADQPYLEHKGKTYPIDFEWKVLLESNAENLDIIILGVPHPVFAALGVKKLASGPLHVSGRCTVYGFDGNQQFGLASGRVEHKPGEAFRLRHYATTTFGFSGSPLIYNGRVVGVHTGCSITSLGDYNLGTALFWTNLAAGESAIKGIPAFQIQQDLDGEPDRVVHFNTPGKSYSIEQKGRGVRLKFKPMDFDAPLTFNKVMSNWADDEDMDWESAPLVSMTTPISPVVYDTTSAVLSPIREEDMDFPSGERSPQNKLNPSSTDRILSLLQEIHRTSVSSSTLPPTPSARQRSRKRKAKAVASGSNTSDVVPIVSLAVQTPSLPASTEPLRNGQISQSGPAPPGELVQNSEVLNSRLVDSNVLVVRFTRRQEKLYNRVCQTRKYQQLWHASSYEEKGFLRRKLLEFVFSSKINLREKQVQDFLAQFSLETTPRC